MPSIDILVPLFFLLFFVGYRVFENHRPVYFWSIYRLLIVSLIVHLALVGFVWQWIPLYVTIILLLVLSIKTLKINQTTDGLSTVRKLLWGFSIGLSALSFLLIWVFPLRNLPEPTGTSPVGTFSWVIDTDREEAYTETPGDTRRFKVQAWYPAEDIELAEKAPWLIDGAAPVQGMARDFGFPGFIFNHLATVEANAYLDVDAALGTHPVVIISHGWTGFRNLHTDLAEELASHGYIVFGTNHSYGSVATVFDDAVAPLNNDALPPRETTPEFLTYANTLVSTFSEDILDTIDAIERLNADETWELAGRLDLSKIAVIGHSTGGGASVLSAMNDDRIQTVIGLDAWVEPIAIDRLEEGLDVPALLLRSEAWEISFNNEYLYTLMNATDPGLLEVHQVTGTTHYDFGMVYMFSTLSPILGLQGSLGMEMPTLQNALVLDTLAANLIGESPLDVSAYDTLTPVIPE